MTKRSATNKLTIYRRHAASCPHKHQPRILDQCECPFWVHGKLHGTFIRKKLDTRHIAAAIMKRDEMIRRGEDDPTPPGNGGIRPINAPHGDISIAAAIQDFMGSKATKASNTHVLYQRAALHFARFCEAQKIVLLKDIDQSHVRDYFAEFGTGRTRNTAHSRLVHLRVFFNFCTRERHWLPYSPAASRDLNFRKANTKSASTRLPFAPQEVTRILAAIDLLPQDERDRARALILLLLYSGMRISDATFLERSYIDAANNLCYWIIKSRKELECSFELQPAAIAALNALPASRVYFFQPDRPDNYRAARHALRSGGEFEFDKAMPDYQARVYEATSVVVKVLRLAGLRGACHRFRDTFAVNMLHGGADLFTVSQFLGHSDTRITSMHYIKFVPGYRERIAQRTRVLNYQLPVAVAG